MDLFIFRGVLTEGEVSALRAKTDAFFADPKLAERTNPHLADVRYIQMGAQADSQEPMPFILRNTIELDPIFRDMLLREPILSLAEAIVGEKLQVLWAERPTEPSRTLN